MPDFPARVALLHQTRQRKTPNVFRDRLHISVDRVNDIKECDFRMLRYQDKYLNPAVIRNAFEMSLKFLGPL